MDISIEWLLIVIIEKDGQTVRKHTVDGNLVHLKRVVFVKRTVHLPMVDHAVAGCSACIDLQQSEGQHGFVVLVESHFFACFVQTSVNQTVVGYAVFYNVVTHEHIQAVPRILVVIACADLNTVIASIIIPTCSRFSAILVSVVGEGDQIVDRIDLVLLQHIVGLHKDSITQHTLSGCIEERVLNIVSCILLGFTQRINQSGQFQCIVED